MEIAFWHLAAAFGIGYVGGALGVFTAWLGEEKRKLRWAAFKAFFDMPTDPMEPL